MTWPTNEEIAKAGVWDGTWRPGRSEIAAKLPETVGPSDIPNLLRCLLVAVLTQPVGGGGMTAHEFARISSGGYVR